MKTFAACAVGGIVTFILSAFQLGLFEPARPEASEPVEQQADALVQPAKAPLPFPEGLYSAYRGQPVPEAAEFKAAADGHPLVLLTPKGNVHPWQEYLDSDWQAQSVERTQLVVLLSPEPQRKILLSVQKYPNGAPPVSRYKYELDVHVIEARSGKMLASRRFYTVPRQVRALEAWELTALGEPVPFRQVFRWIKTQARSATSVQTAGNQ